MTAYHGGKQRIGKKLPQIIYEESLDIEDDFDFTIKGYCEPFAGMLGVYQHIPELFDGHKPKLKYKAGDTNKSLILMWKALQEGWKLPTKKITKQEFITLGKNNSSSASKGFIGFFYGYMGKYFQPFRHNVSQDRLNNTINKLHLIGKKLKQVKFRQGVYTNFSSLKGYIIYCDPPYEIQNHYYQDGGEKLKFDNQKFWDWCRKMAKDNIVFVSEYKAPKDFEQIHKFGKNKEKLYLMF
jgi:DNA adenine methylase